MVGDIIQDPLGNFVSGALAAGAWTVKSGLANPIRHVSKNLRVY